MHSRSDIREAISTAARSLADAGIGSAQVDAELLAAHVAGVDRGRLRLWTYRAVSRTATGNWSTPGRSGSHCST